MYFSRKLMFTASIVHVGYVVSSMGWVWCFSKYFSFTLPIVILSLIHTYLSPLSSTSLITPVRSHSETETVLPRLLSLIQSSEFYICVFLSLSKIRKEFTYSERFVGFRNEMYPFCKGKQIQQVP